MESNGKNTETDNHMHKDWRIENKEKNNYVMTNREWKMTS